MRPFDPRLARYATGVRRLIVLSVVLGVLSALVVIVQAVLLAGILAEVIIGGAGLEQVADHEHAGAHLRDRSPAAWGCWPW